MKNIRIIYDVYNILLGQKKYQYRAGIYYCSINILEKLLMRGDIEILLYTKNKRLMSFSKKVNVLKGLKFIGIQDYSIYIKNINFYLNSISISNNFILKFISLLKIINNTLRIMLINKNYNKKYLDKELQNVDVFFSPEQSVPIIINRYNIKRFVLLHDVTPHIHPEYFPEGYASLWKNDIINYLDKETYCFCNSEYTKRDFIKYFGGNLDENKMTVTYISSATEFEPKYDQQAIDYIANKYKLGINQYKYIFSFCSLEPRKNIIFTIKCFINFIQKNNIKDLYFLLGGEQWGNFIKYLNETLSELPENYRSKIVLLGYVDDSDVNMLYSNSLFFTYLSQYEGFGMPVLEAMQAGTPVISSNNTSLPEVTGDAAITIDYDDEEACIKAMETFYFNENVRQTYIKKGFEQAKLFSWDKTVNLITNKIKEVI
jgi:glycosyltransferase involved in cell wall biosynthesis